MKAPPRQCEKCRRVVSGKCPTCEKPRQSAAKRGYNRQWKRFRLNVMMERDGTCEDCGSIPSELSELELHHVVKLVDDPSRKLDRTNVRLLCKGCHSKRTNRGE